MGLTHTQYRIENSIAIVTLNRPDEMNAVTETMRNELSEHRDGAGQISLSILSCRKPVIAAINGHAVGMGITMTLPMDIRIAAEDARIGFVFTRRGVVPEACSSWFLPRIVGIAKAAEIITVQLRCSTGKGAFQGNGDCHRDC